MKVYVIIEIYDSEDTEVLGVLTSKSRADELAKDPNVTYEEFELDEIETSEPMKLKDPEPLEDMPASWLVEEGQRIQNARMPLLSQLNFKT